MKDNIKLYNFLVEDLIKLEQDIEADNKENIEMFFSYWKQHIKKLTKNKYYEHNSF
tara:strand:- start:78 stop:245 length:168 start_codon:yes stop_codon:yes gene_type:complete